MNKLKVVLSVLFVVTISFFVVRGCVEKPIGPEAARKAVLKKKIIYKKVVSGKETAPGPQMAIILDDWGYNFSLMKYAVAIQRPVTLAVLPHLPFSRKVAEEARRNGLGVMLHMPMQPEVQTKALESHTLSSEMSDREIIKYLDSAIEDVPYAEGVNNHQGSGAVSNLRMMKLILGHLAAKGLFFIDSYTTAKTVAPQVARQLGMKFTKRDVFIDNKMDPEAIKTQLREGVKKALRRGRVIVIGHAKKMTLLTIKQMVPEIEVAGIRLVLVKDLVE